MPNWVENDLRISGPRDELKRFKEVAKGSYLGEEEELCADKFIPYPTEFKKQDELSRKQADKREELKKKLVKEGLSEDKAREEAFKKFPHIKDGYNEGGYSWCIDNWGTKWGFCDVELIEENIGDKEDKYNELFYSFNTAWSPPNPLIKKMGVMFPKLNFDLRYFEQGCGFNGMLRIEKGKVIDDKTGEYFGDRGG